MTRRDVAFGLAGVVLAIAGLAGCSKAGGDTAAGGNAAAGVSGSAAPLSIAVIPKGSTHEHWARVRSSEPRRRPPS